MPERIDSIHYRKRLQDHNCLLFLNPVSLRLQAAWDGMCQPWFYRRLEAYGFVGLSEGA